MARAGFCSECGDNVHLDDEGRCPDGHGPECVTDAYDVDDDIAQEDGSDSTDEQSVSAVSAAQADDAPVVSDMTAPEPSHGAAVTGETPPRNRSGMLVFAAAAVLLLVALIAGAFALVPALKKSGGSAEKPNAAATAKERVQTSIAFLNALFADDTLKIRPLLTEEARNAITDEQWQTVASAFPTTTVGFTEPKWSSDSTAVVVVNTEGSEATLTVGASANSTDTVNIVLDVEGSSERALLRLVQESSKWHVLSITDASGGATLYDDAFVQSLYEEASSK